LREWGRRVNVSYFDYSFVRDIEEQTRYCAAFIGRFLEIDSHTMQQIRDLLLKETGTGSYLEKNKAAVLWWQP